MPLLWISLSFLCGVALGKNLVEPALSWFVGCAICTFGLLLSLYLFQRKNVPIAGFGQRLRNIWPPDNETLLPGWLLPFLPLILVAGALYFRASILQATPSHLAWYNDREQVITIEGSIVSDPEFRDKRTLLVLEAENLGLENAESLLPIEGRVLVSLMPGDEWRFGDRVRLQGRLQTPFENEEFSYQEYLANQGIYSVVYCSKVCGELISHSKDNPIKAAIFALRRQAHLVVHSLFPDPEAALLAGILLGIETGIPEPVLDAFRITGTAHIIAISGFNFAIISGLLVKFFGRILGPWRSLPAALLGIGFYTVLAGASAGVVRAAVMGSLSLFAARLGRRSSGINTLAFVAFVMALIDPHVLWDVSFQLSFMATLGLILYSEPLTEVFKRLAERFISPQVVSRLAQPASEYFLLTIAAQVTTLPLMLYIFKQASLISLITNPLILPAQPPLMVLGGLAVVVGMIIKPLGQFIAYLAWPFIAFTIRVVELIAGSYLTDWTIGPLSLTWLFGYYGLLFALTLFGSNRRAMAGQRPGFSPDRLLWITNLGLALLVVMVWRQIGSLPDGRLHLTVLDVGDGEALLIKTPSGANLLVNGGSSLNTLADALGRRLPFTNRTVDYLIVAGSSDGQIGALPRALDRFRVRNVLWSGPKKEGYRARELQSRLAEDNIPIYYAEQGQVLDLGSGAFLEVTAVTPRGAVLLLKWGNFRALLSIGLDFDSMEALMKDRNLVTVTSLLLADGGYAPLNPPEWITHWRSQVILLSVGAGNEEGLPSAETLAALDGYSLLRTDQNGWIELSTDGGQMWVEVETD